MARVFGEPEAHPVAALVARFHADLDQLGDPRLWSIGDTELAETLASVAALRHRLGELELRVAHHADRLDLGATDAHNPRYEMKTIPNGRVVFSRT